MLEGGRRGGGGGRSGRGIRRELYIVGVACFVVGLVMAVGIERVRRWVGGRGVVLRVGMGRRRGRRRAGGVSFDGGMEAR